MTSTENDLTQSVGEAVPVSAGDAPDRVAGITIAEPVNPAQMIGGYRTPDHKYYFNGQGPVPGVTDVLKVVDKPLIGKSREKKALRFLMDEWSRLIGEGSIPVSHGSFGDEWIKWVRNQVDSERDTAAELGTEVHILADALGASETASNGFTPSKASEPYLDAFRAFLGRYSASSIISSEKMVWSYNGYGGTYDLLMRIEGQLWLIDIKTSAKGPFPEWGLQLAAYGYADLIIVPGVPQGYRMPEIQRFGVLHLRPDLYPVPGYRLWEYPITYKDDYLRFLAALELYNWKKGGRFYKQKLTAIE